MKLNKRVIISTVDEGVTYTVHKNKEGIVEGAVVGVYLLDRQGVFKDGKIVVDKKKKK